jgi:hypothetical protein
VRAKHDAGAPRPDQCHLTFSRDQKDSNAHTLNNKTMQGIAGHGRPCEAPPWCVAPSGRAHRVQGRWVVRPLAAMLESAVSPVAPLMACAWRSAVAQGLGTRLPLRVVHGNWHSNACVLVAKFIASAPHAWPPSQRRHKL